MTALHTLAASVAEMRQRTDKAAAIKNHLTQQLKDKQHQLTKATEKLQLLEKCTIVLTQLSDTMRRSAIQFIEERVTAALKAVFGEGYSYELRHRMLREQAAVEPVIILATADGVRIETQPEDGSGGVADVVSLALRMALLELDGGSGPLFLDESGKHVDVVSTAAMARWLGAYSQHTSRQIVMVTHKEELGEAADLTVQVARGSEGWSEVVRHG